MMVVLCETVNTLRIETRWVKLSILFVLSVVKSTANNVRIECDKCHCRLNTVRIERGKVNRVNTIQFERGKCHCLLFVSSVVTKIVSSVTTKACVFNFSGT